MRSRLNRALRRKDADELGEVLASGSGGHRVAAAAGLRHLPASEAEEALFEGLRDSNRWVRQAALDSLISLDPERPAEPILRALRSAPGAPDPLNTSEFFTVGLFRLPTLDATSHIARFVAHEDPNVRSLAVIAIEENNDPAQLGHLNELLTDSDEIVRGDAISAAGKVGDSSLVPHLQEVAKSSRRHRRAARKAIKRIEGRMKEGPHE